MLINKVLLLRLGRPRKDMILRPKAREIKF